MFFPIDRPALPKIVAEAPLFAWMLLTGFCAQTSGRELHPLKSSAFHGALLRQLTVACVQYQPVQYNSLHAFRVEPSLRTLGY
jgi:hypothetical protein